MHHYLHILLIIFAHLTSVAHAARPDYAQDAAFAKQEGSKESELLERNSIIMHAAGLQNSSILQESEGVSQTASEQGQGKSATKRSRRGEPVKVSLLQFNILADGLADDGFLSSRPLDTTNSFFSRVRDTITTVNEMKHIKLDEGEDKVMRAKKYFAKATSNDFLRDEPLPAGHILDPEEVATEKDFLRRKMNWEHRFWSIAGKILEENPDIVTFQELDHYAEMARVLGGLGYTSVDQGSGFKENHRAEKLEKYNELMRDRLLELDGLEKSWSKTIKKSKEAVGDAKKAFKELVIAREELITNPEFIAEHPDVDLESVTEIVAMDLKITAAKQTVKDKKDELEAQEGYKEAAVNNVYKKHLFLLAENKIAFAPKALSNARSVYIRNNKLKLSEQDKLAKDDEGLAIFWKETRFGMARPFKLDDTTFLPIGVTPLTTQARGDPKAALRVILEPLEIFSTERPNYRLAIFTTHLASGPEKEMRRHFELQKIYHDMVKPFVAHGIPHLFAGDLNSDMNFNFNNGVFTKKGEPTPMRKELKTSCFRIISSTGDVAGYEKEPKDKGSTIFESAATPLTSWKMRSVYDIDSIPGVKAMDLRPPSVVKMRGPGTDQPHKMGDLQMETIDHIFYSSTKDISGDGESLLEHNQYPDGSWYRVVGPRLGVFTALQVRAIRELVGSGVATGEELVGEDGTVYVWPHSLSKDVATDPKEISTPQAMSDEEIVFEHEDVSPMRPRYGSVGSISMSHTESFDLSPKQTGTELHEAPLYSSGSKHDLATDDVLGMSSFDGFDFDMMDHVKKELQNEKPIRISSKVYCQMMGILVTISPWLHPSPSMGRRHP